MKMNFSLESANTHLRVPSPHFWVWLIGVPPSYVSTLNHLNTTWWMWYSCSSLSLSSLLFNHSLFFFILCCALALNIFIRVLLPLFLCADVCLPLCIHLSLSLFCLPASLFASSDCHKELLLSWLINAVKHCTCDSIYTEYNLHRIYIISAQLVVGMMA